MVRCRWRGISTSLGSGFEGRDSPLIGFSVDTLTLIQSAKGWSGFQRARRLIGRWEGSKEGQRDSSRPGQDCIRAGTPFALDEIVSMTWPQWNCQGSWGQERRPSRWVQGKRSFPRVAQSGDTGWMALKRVQYPGRAKARGSTGERSVSLARSAGYYPAHLATER